MRRRKAGITARQARRRSSAVCGITRAPAGSGSKRGFRALILSGHRFRRAHHPQGLARWHSAARRVTPPSCHGRHRRRGRGSFCHRSGCVERDGAALPPGRGLLQRLDQPFGEIPRPVGSVVVIGSGKTAKQQSGRMPSAPCTVNTGKVTRVRRTPRSTSGDGSLPERKSSRRWIAVIRPARRVKASGFGARAAVRAAMRIRAVIICRVILSRCCTSRRSVFLPATLERDRRPACCDGPRHLTAPRAARRKMGRPFSSATKLTPTSTVMLRPSVWTR